MQYEHVVSSRIDYYLNDLHLSTRGSVRDRADRLDAYFRSKDGKDGEILVCDVCDGHSPAHFDDCPYCGESGIDSTRTKPISDIDPDTGIQYKTVYYIDDLDRLQREIEITKRTVAFGLHRLGKLFGLVRKNALWRLRRRREKTGEQLYNAFTRWIENETTFSFSSVQRLISLAGRVNKDQYCNVLLPELLAVVRTWELKKRLGLKNFTFKGSNVDRREVRPILRYTEDDGYHIEEKNDEDEDEESIGTPLNQRYKLPIRPENRMERVDLNIGISRVPMWKRTQPDARAEVLRDDPWLELKLNESVSLFVRIVRTPEGKLEAMCETKRTN